MKYYTSLLLAASLSAGALVPVMAQPVTPPKAHAPKARAPKSQNGLYRSIQATIRAKKYPEAVVQAEQALQIEGLLVSDKIRFLNIAADATIRQGAAHYPAALLFYEKIIADPAIDNMQKIETFKDMSEAYIKTLDGHYLDKMDLSPAHTLLNRALKLQNLKSEEQAAALQNIGNLYAREDNVDKALDTYQQVLKLDKSAETESSVWHSIARVYVNVGQNDKAESIYKAHDFDLISLYTQLAEWGKATALVVKILDNPQSNDSARWAAFGRLPAIYRTSGRNQVRGDIRYNAIGFRESIRTIQSLSSKYLPDFMKVDPNRASILLTTFNSTPVFNDSGYGRTLVNPDYLAWAAPLLLKAKLKDKDYTLVRTKYVDALSAIGNDKQVVSETASMQTDSRLSKDVQFWARLVNVAFTSPTADVAKVVNAEKGLSDGDKAKVVLNATKTVLAAGKDQDGERLHAVYEILVPEQPKAEVKSTFVDKAPVSVEGWLSSPLLKDKGSAAKLDRPYGDNLKQLLATDATATGRDTDTSSKKNTGDTDSNLYVASDTQGIHLFLDLRDSHAQEVMDGFVKGGSVEMYFAPGKNQPYLAFIPRIPAGFKGSATSMGYGPGSFITMYPNSGWRLPTPEDGTLQTDAQPTGNGFGLSLFLSWDLFYDKLPSNGTKWQYEAIRWTRSGGRSFGGSQSVHNPSSWGNIVFSGMTDEKLNAIKRNIIIDAVAKYRASIAGIKSPIGQWNDPELGDPAFYQSDVAPLLARLNKYASQVNKDMTPADVETVFNEAVPGWMEIEYQVAALHTQYVENNLFAK